MPGGASCAGPGDVLGDEMKDSLTTLSEDALAGAVASIVGPVVEGVSVDYAGELIQGTSARAVTYLERNDGSMALALVDAVKRHKSTGRNAERRMFHLAFGSLGIVPLGGLAGQGGKLVYDLYIQLRLLFLMAAIEGFDPNRGDVTEAVRECALLADVQHYPKIVIKKAGEKAARGLVSSLTKEVGWAGVQSARVQCFGNSDVCCDAYGGHD